MNLPGQRMVVLQHIITLSADAGNFWVLCILTIHISKKLLCLLSLKAAVFKGKVKPKEIHCED